NRSNLKREIKTIKPSRWVVPVFDWLQREGALALGPEGPLVEEFWDNVRRYAIYALT
ncbi:hypothetical protein Csa_022671, partial [Cucumis sativus]